MPRVRSARAHEQVLSAAQELFSDEGALFLRLPDLRERRQELLLGGFDRDHTRAHCSKHAAHHFRLAVAHQAGIDVHSAHAIRSQRPQAQRESDC